MEIKYNEVGKMIVTENHCCEHWEPDDGALVPMKECWCCRWSEFRADNSSLSSDGVGVCNYSGNRVELAGQDIQ